MRLRQPYRKKIETNSKTQSLINSMLKDKIKKKIFIIFLIF